MRATLCMAVLLLAGCSLGYIDNESGGSSNLPTLGAGPFAKPLIDFDTPAEEPYVIVQNRVSLYEPTVLPREDGGFRLWFSRQEDDTEEVQIWAGEIPGILELPDTQLAPALVADQAWEEGRVSSPAVVELADGRLFMLYEGGIAAPGIGLAISTDGGANWQKGDANPVIPDATSPGLGDARGELLAVFTRPGNDQEIFAADSGDGTTWEVRSESIIQTRTGDGDAFDQMALSSPSLFIRETVTGRLHYGLHFGGLNKDGDAGIGYAASFDGREWERFLGPDPVVSSSPPVETGPTLSVRGPRAFLFFSQPRQLRGAIAVGVHP